jgi:hypothetical protein
MTRSTYFDLVQARSQATPNVFNVGMFQTPNWDENENLHIRGNPLV